MAQRRLSEVAKKVGVSEATVSRVLNGKPGVSEATRQAVLTALDVLGYERPTQLRGERARLVGLVLPELQNPIFPALAEVVGGALAQQGFTPVLCTRTGRRVRGGLRRTAAGSNRCPASSSPAAATPQADAAARALLPAGADRKLPVVLVNASIDLGFPVRLLRRRGGRRAGVRRTWSRSATSGSAWCSARATTSRRAASWPRSGGRADAASSWPSTSTSIGHAMFSIEGGQAVGTRLLQSGVTGLICASDLLALGVDPRGPPARALACPTTSRSSATTTRPS